MLRGDRCCIAQGRVLHTRVHGNFGGSPTVPRYVIARANATATTHHTKADVVVIGGGPAGLCVALLLSKRGWRNITVLEKLPDLEHEDPTKSYVYAIDGRGRKATDLLGLTDKVKEAGVETSDMHVIRVPMSGPAKTSSLQIKDSSKQTYWMPRKKFLGVLLEGVQAAVPGSINIQRNSTCSEIRKTADGTLQVVANVDDTQVTYEPSLLVGADGLNSCVRQSLEKWDTSGRFTMHKVDSPAAGLRYKVMLLPPNPPGNKDGSLRITNSSIAVVEGKGMRLGLLPIKDPNSARTGNIILKPDHPFWSITSVDQLYETLETSFPQLPIRELLPLDQAQKYVATSGGHFPKPQSCNGMHMLFTRQPSEQPSPQQTPASSATDGHSAVAASTGQAVLLVGDAVHCFPPDLGQGVNSALEDVAMLNQVLTECDDKLDVALPLFDQRRMPDVKALIELMQWGAPYQSVWGIIVPQDGWLPTVPPCRALQYNQDPTARTIWTANFMLRLALSKVLPFMAPPAFMMVQDPQISYSQIVERCHRTTKVLQALLGATVVAALAILSGKI